jgi:hypothetical protein
VIEGHKEDPEYLLGKTPLITLAFVATITEVEKLALDLPENQRAILAAHLLGSLPAVLHDEDEGIAEALRRDAELDTNASSAISLKELDEQIELRHRSGCDWSESTKTDQALRSILP